MPNMFGEGSLSCMPLASCSSTWLAVLLGFFSIQPTTVFYSTVRGQMQLFQLKYGQENTILSWQTLSWSSFSTKVEDDSSGCCVLLHQTDSKVCHVLSHPHCFLQCLLPFFPFSFLLPPRQFPFKLPGRSFLAYSKMGWIPERILTIEIHKTLKSQERGYTCLYKKPQLFPLFMMHSNS